MTHSAPDSSAPDSSAPDSSAPDSSEPGEAATLSEDAAQSGDAPPDQGPAPGEAATPGGQAAGDQRPGDQAAVAADGVLDLLGLLAYAELVAFFRLSDDAALAPSLADKAALGEMAVSEFGHFRLLCGQISRMDADPDQVMSPFVAALDDFHARTPPADWLEGLVKAYVGDGIAADFYRAVAELVDPQSRALVLDVLADTGHAEFVIARVRAAIEQDPQVAGRLALWARRLVGEALAQAHRVAAERGPLARLLARGHQDGSAGELGEIARMFAGITDEHAQRMAALGLANWGRAPTRD